MFLFFLGHEKKVTHVHHTSAVWKFAKHPGHSGTQHCMQMYLVFHVHAASRHAFALHVCGELTAKLIADDLILAQGVIRSRAAPSLQSIESHPSIQGFVWHQGSGAPVRRSLLPRAPLRCPWASTEPLNVQSLGQPTRFLSLIPQYVCVHVYV